MFHKYLLSLVILGVFGSSAHAVTYQCSGVDLVNNQISLKLYPSSGGQHDMQVTMKLGGSTKPGGTTVLKNVEFNEKVEVLTPQQRKGIAQFIEQYGLPFHPQDIVYGQNLAFKREGAVVFGMARYFNRRKQFAFATGLAGFVPFPCSK